MQRPGAARHGPTRLSPRLRGATSRCSRWSGPAPVSRWVSRVGVARSYARACPLAATTVPFRWPLVCQHLDRLSDRFHMLRRSPLLAYAMYMYSMCNLPTANYSHCNGLMMPSCTTDASAADGNSHNAQAIQLLQHAAACVAAAALPRHTVHLSSSHDLVSVESDGLVL